MAQRARLSNGAVTRAAVEVLAEAPSSTCGPTCRIVRMSRICFRWTAAGPEDVEIVDYH